MRELSRIGLLTLVCLQVGPLLVGLDRPHRLAVVRRLQWRMVALKPI